MISVVGGWLAIASTVFVLLPYTINQWNHAELNTLVAQRETPFPFQKLFGGRGSWNFVAENGLRQREIWQVHLARSPDAKDVGCNQVLVYRGWLYVGGRQLRDGDTYTGNMTVSYPGWDRPLDASNIDTVSQHDQTTGLEVQMNPITTTVNLRAKNGRTRTFTLEGAGLNIFSLR